MIAVLALLLSSSPRALALDYTYPELAVSPRATERLKIEQSPAAAQALEQVPLALLGVTTLYSGLNSSSVKESKRDDKSSYAAATAIGATWLGVAAWMQFSYAPYQTGLVALAKLPAKTPREQLIQERLAEEHIHAAAALAKKIKWLSFSSALATNAWVFADSRSGSTGKTAALVGAIASAAPLLFPHRFERVSEEQRNYKKRIFGPLSLAPSLLSVPSATQENRWVSGLTASARF